MELFRYGEMAGGLAFSIALSVRAVALRRVAIRRGLVVILRLLGLWAELELALIYRRHPAIRNRRERAEHGAF